MKKTLLSLLAILAVSTYMYSKPVYADAHCIVQSEKDFEVYVAQKNFDMYTLSKPALEKFLKLMNDERAKVQAFPIEADKVSMAIIDPERKLVGLVMFKDGCVVPGTVLVFNLSDIINFMKKAGITPEEISEVIHI